MRPEGPAHLMESESFSAAPSALSWEMARNPGLTAGPTHCRPFGPDRRGLPIVGQPREAGVRGKCSLSAEGAALLIPGILEVCASPGRDCVTQKLIGSFGQ